MAFQTSVLRGGEWVTRTVNLGDAVSRAHATAASKPARQRIERTPDYGIITRTVIDSPVTRWILPARLRSAQHMDVAIVGDRYVNISELDRDGRLREVIRYTHFQSTIINAKVIGSPPEHTHNESRNQGQTKVKTEDEVSFERDDMITAYNGLAMDCDSDKPRSSSSTASHSLPPQQLVLVLESGNCVLLFLRPKNAPEGYEFVTVSSPGPYRHRFTYPGHHTTVDPSCRYLALGCTENLFVVYELASQRDLAQAYARGESLQLFKSVRPRAVQGNILHMHFLYPRPHDDYHIILLLLVERNGDTRMVTYDWEAGDNLGAVLAEEKRGQPVPALHRVPLLVVPLTVCSAFFAISSNTIGVCKNVLDVPAEFENIVVEGHAPASSFQGNRLPIWTAWTRPYRLPTYSTERDNIYLAREDGVIMFLDIDSDNILGASVEIGKFECSIGTSFCSLFDDFNDILIMGGHCGPGTISQVRPRQPNVKLDTIPNWSPICDFVTTDEFAVCDGVTGAAGQKMVPWNKRLPNTYTRPDRVFAACGRGPTSMITEFRNGLRANIGLDIDYETPVKQSWIFSIPPSSDDAEPDNTGYHMLISLVDKSVALHLSADLTQASQLDESTAPYDLASRTVTAVQVPGGTVVQVTETSVVLVHKSKSVRHSYEAIFNSQQLLVADACVHGSYIAISATVGSVFQIHLLQIDKDGKDGGFQTTSSFFPSCDVTCLSLGMISDSPCIVAGLLLNGRPSIAVYADAHQQAAPSYVDLNSEELSTLRHPRLRDADRSSSVLLETLSSIFLTPQKGNRMAIVGGTRGGDIVTVLLDEAGKTYAFHSEKVGLTATQVTLVEDPRLRQAILVVCDGRVSLQAGLDLETAKFHFMHTVYAVDAGDSTKTTPFISSATVFADGLPEHTGRTQLVLSAGSRVMLAELNTLPGPAHRFLPVGGTITKLLYSHTLNSLIVGVTDEEGRATLRFLDPDTGDDISYATDKASEQVEFVSGLGKPDDRILGLEEWSYERDGDKWVFLLVSTRCGRVLVLSTTPRPNDDGGGTAARPGGQPERRGKIKYWTRFKRPRFQEPVFSVVGWNNNVFYCVGATLYWDQLDLADKRLRTMGTFELGSHATSLRVVNGRIVALTDRDSVEVIDIGSGATGTMTLVHADSYWRQASHMIEVGAELTGDKLEASLLLVSHWNGSVVGLWVPWQQPGRDCNVVFRTSVPMSVRKLVRGRTRPSWQQARRQAQYGLVPSTPDGAEILGASIDGSVQHFTIISLPLFMVLCLVEELANDAPDSVWNGMAASAAAGDNLDGSDDEFDSIPPNGLAHGRRVDGGVLQRCLDSRVLESLFSKPSNVAELVRRLDRIDGGRWTAGLKGNGNAGEGGAGGVSDDRKAKYLALLYDILEYYMAPVL